MDESQIVVREDVTKVLGGRMYYLAERHTDKGVFGFWVNQDWKDKHAPKINDLQDFSMSK